MGAMREIASELLQEAGWATLICNDLANLCVELDNGAAFGVVVEEALATIDHTCLAEWISKQPAWSDFPIVVLTSHGNEPGRQATANHFLDILGNVSFLERPFHPSTLISVARSALRSRRRQYQAREMLERHSLLAAELQHRTKNLLAVIRAIASASLDDSQGREAFFSRLHALAAAQDLIIGGAGRGALMKDVVGKAVEGFGRRISMEGPEVFLNPNAAQGFALILHELMTNATKHGALKTEEGRFGALVIRCYRHRSRYPLPMAGARWPAGQTTQAQGLWQRSARTRRRHCWGPASIRLCRGGIYL